MYTYIYIYIPAAPLGLAHDGPKRARPTRAQGGPQRPGPQGPRGAHKGPSYKGSREPTRAKPARAHHAMIGGSRTQTQA